MKTELVIISKNELEQLLTEIIQKEIKRIESILLKDKNEDEDLITFNEALRLLKISPPTLFKHMKNGIIPFHKVGRRLLFPKQKILLKIALTQ